VTNQDKRRQAEADQELLDKIDEYQMAASYDEEPTRRKPLRKLSVRVSRQHRTSVMKKAA
jgi:hypothetical protein